MPCERRIEPSGAVSARSSSRGVSVATALGAAACEPRSGESCEARPMPEFERLCSDCDAHETPGFGKVADTNSAVCRRRRGVAQQTWIERQAVTVPVQDARRSCQHRRVVRTDLIGPTDPALDQWTHDRPGPQATVHQRRSEAEGELAM